MSTQNKKIIALFDVDGTLTPARKRITPEVLESLKKLREKIVVGVVGGSDFAKQREQLGDNVLDLVDYSFSENGLVGYKDGKLFHTKTIKEELGDAKIRQFVDTTLAEIAKIDIPIKRGTFIEFRTGMFNISPIGRNCSQQEREDFEKYDKEHKIRETLLKTLDAKYGEAFNLKFSIGGQISMDVFPKGWDKTYCLQHLHGFDEIHFFGDKTYPGGNDYEIYEHKGTIGHCVKSPADTLKLLDELWLKK